MASTEEEIKSLLIEEQQTMSFDDLVARITEFQEQLQSLDYRVTNKNFGSKLYQTKETINTKSRFVAGAGDETVIIDAQHPTYRLWAGNEDPALAPFSVDKLGNMIATSLDLSTYLQVGEALSDVQADILGLDDISDDLGTIVAGNLVGVTVTGGTVRTAASGARVQMKGSSNTLEIYDTSRKRMELDGDSLYFYNSSGVNTASLTASSYALEIDARGAAFGGWLFNSSYGVYFSSGTVPIVLIADDGLHMDATAGGDLFANDIFPNSGDYRDLGSSSAFWNRTYTTTLYMGGNIYMDDNDVSGIDDLFFNANTSSPGSAGQMRYYASGGTYQMRVKVGTFVGSVDLTAA
jgi:hypothetical protein